MNKTLIVDGNSLLFRAYYSTAYTGNIMTTKNGTPINAIFSFHNLIKKIKTMVSDNDHLFVTFDTGKPTFRKQEFEEYKAQRAPCPEELKAQMPIAREMLDAMDINWKELEGYEGDDLAGSMAKYAANKGDEVILFTSDKDFLQLLDLSSNVHVCFLKKGLTETIDYTKENLHSLFGLNPDQITDYKGIAGDSSDNYKGIKGVGEKTAMKLLNEYGHLDEVIQYCQNNPTPKINQKIIEGAKQAQFFKQLATIEVDLDMSIEYEKSLYSHYHKQKLADFYLKYNLAQFFQNIDKMPGIILLNSNDESTSKKETTRDNINIKSYKEIDEDVLSFSYDSSSDNENTSTLFSFVFATKNHTYTLQKKDAINDESFIAFLTDADKKIGVYDLKGIQVLLNRHNLPKLTGVDFDLLLATYLLNPDVGMKREALFLNYSIELDQNKNIASQIVSHTADLKDEIMNKIKENEEEKLFKSVELPLADILSSMEIEGFPINRNILEEIDDEYNHILNDIEKEIYSLCGEIFNINSPKQLDNILFNKLGIVKNKGEKGTGIEVLNAHIDDHPVISKIIQYRLYSKLISGYTQALPAHIFEDGKIHALYNQALTSTGRLSMSEPNLQNISIRNEEGKNIRKAFFYKEEGYSLLSLDYSQIELRMLAHVANIHALKEIFKEGKDIHASTAAKVFNVPFDEVTSDMRRKAKAVNFGIVYGISSYGLSLQLGITPKEASELIKQFKSAFEGIDEFQKECVDKAKKDGFVTTILNRRRYLKDINSSNYALRSFSERAATNTVIQGSAADLIKVAMIKCHKALEGFESKIILQIHDELIFKIKDEEYKKVLPILKNCMETALDLSVPLLVDGNKAKTWYEAH